MLFNNFAWGQDGLHDVIHQSIKVLNTEATITKNRDSNWIEIKHPKELDKLEIAYVLHYTK